MAYKPRKYTDATRGKPYNRSRTKKVASGTIVTYDFPPWLNYITCVKCGENAGDYGDKVCSNCKLFKKCFDYGKKLAMQLEKKILKALTHSPPPTH